jgi:hypothetical protein
MYCTKGAPCVAIFLYHPYFLSYNSMSCISAVSSNCSFAADRLVALQSEAFRYAKMQKATIDAGVSGKLDTRIVMEDITILENKIKETMLKMHLLAPCVRR